MSKNEEAPKKTRKKVSKRQKLKQDMPANQALVRVAENPPVRLPTIVLSDIVPFPGAMVPVLLDTDERREVMQKAKAQSGFFLFINRRRVQQAAEDATLLDAEQLEEVARHLSGQPSPDDHEVVSTTEETSEGEPSVITEAVPIIENGADARSVLTLKLAELAPVGIVARLARIVRLPDGRLSALVQLLRRAQPVELLAREPCVMMRVMYPAETVSDSKNFAAIERQVRLTLQGFFAAHPTLGEDIKAAAMSIESPSTIADFVAQHLSRDFAERMSFLVEVDLGRRMRQALGVSLRELDLLTVGNRISQGIREKVEKHQREFLLREQLKSIRVELGEEKEPGALAHAELKARLEKLTLPKPARQRVEDELGRLQLLPSESPEHNVVRSYLDTIASLPWNTSTKETHDIVRARAILDEDHYGLEEVKDRIIEFLAVHQLNPRKVGTLMCLSGPPGVGKTSLGKSIARALGREFYRFSVGGMRDEAEIKGHRRTYIGAMPGRILQGLKQVKTNNPVFMLDELDKIGGDWRGDPSSALLEVLDPAQNAQFSDHYLDLPFDLSRVMFIATANVHTEMAAPLRDRLEVIELPGYIPEEKLEIARRYLLPRQRIEHGLKAGQLQVGPRALGHVVSDYTHEAGVRELERQLAKLCRKQALAVVQMKQKKQASKKGVGSETGMATRVGPDELKLFLGPPKRYDDRLSRRAQNGVAVGLAWTAVGGEVLFIESANMPGKGELKVTGQLGSVMEESARLALAYVRTRAERWGLSTETFQKRDLHLHFPAGAVKKDGPSAGVTVTTALLSLLWNRPVRAKLAMTGELTLRGEVLPVGGIREKVVAARRAGVTCVVLPERNRPDVEEIPAEVRDKIEFVFARTYDDVCAVALGAPPGQPDVAKSQRTSRARAVESPKRTRRPR